MASPPFRVVLGCPSCHGAFATHLFFSDFPDEPHAEGACPWCGARGTVKTGTTAAPATFALVSRSAGAVEHALAPRCGACGRFRVDGACPRCAPAHRDVRVAYRGEPGELTIEGGRAILREGAPPAFHRGQPQPRPIGDPASFRGAVDPARAARIAACVAAGARVPHEASLVPDEVPASVVVHLDGAPTSVALTARATREVPALWEASSMLERLCWELRAGGPPQGR